MVIQIIKKLKRFDFNLCDIITFWFAYPASVVTFTESSINSYNFSHALPNMQKYNILYEHKKCFLVIISICGADEKYGLTLETISLIDDLIGTFLSNIINTYGFTGGEMNWK